MTMAEKILARASGKTEVKAGQYVTARIDRLMAGNGAAPLYHGFTQIGIKKVWDPKRIVVLMDHDTPARDIQAAEEDVAKRKFVKEFGITEWYEIGRSGVCHQLMPEKGHTLPGMLVAGMDSHTTSYGAFNVASTAIQAPEAFYVAAKGEIWFRVPETIRFEITGKLGPRMTGKDVILKIAGDYGTDTALYKSVEFVGPGVAQMSLADRWTMANMGVEIGAKFAIFEADQKTLDFLKGRAKESFTPVKSDPDAVFERSHRLDVANLEPQIACPHDVGNVKGISAIGKIPINQAFIGSCTGGRFEDLALALEVMDGRKVHPDVRMIVIPGSTEVYQRALKEGLLAKLVDAGAMVCGPCCGPCAGGSLGILAAGERCIAASNRNFRGRMGSPDSEVYLGSSATVAASAVKGFIADPRAN
ncbi:MAG: 3-isopropylmalate dehydratase large subunit [Chloroflexota bacterium]